MRPPYAISNGNSNGNAANGTVNLSNFANANYVVGQGPQSLIAHSNSANGVSASIGTSINVGAFTGTSNFPYDSAIYNSNANGGTSGNAVTGHLANSDQINSNNYPGSLESFGTFQIAGSGTGVSLASNGYAIAGATPDPYAQYSSTTTSSTTSGPFRLKAARPAPRMKVADKVKTNSAHNVNTRTKDVKSYKQLPPRVRLAEPSNRKPAQSQERRQPVLSRAKTAVLGQSH